MLDLPALTYAKFRFTLEALQTLYLPEYKGSTLRGGFGHAFRKVVCTMGPIPCDTCLLQSQCPYPGIFETPVPAEPPPFMRGVKTGPQPFVVEPPPERRRTYSRGERLEFGLVLLGKAVEYLPYFIFTFDQLGRMGIGRAKGKFTLTEVSSVAGEPRPIYDGQSKTLSDDYDVLASDAVSPASHPVERATVAFLTPTRIKVRGQLSTEISFRELVLNLLRRLSTLAYFHVPEAEVEWDWRRLLQSAAEVQVERSRLHWCDWERYSNRQKTRMKLGGFVGEITFRGDLSPWLPLLKIGEQIHVGKGATFGLGKYALNVSGQAAG